MDAKERQAIIDECRNLVIELVHLGDHGEVEKAVDLWVPDGTWIRGGKPFTGRAELIASFQRSTTTTVNRHLVTDTRVIVKDSDHAEGVSYYLVVNNDPKTDNPKLPLPLELFSMGEWHDRYVRTPNGWRFAFREVKRLFQRAGAGH